VAPTCRRFAPPTPRRLFRASQPTPIKAALTGWEVRPSVSPTPSVADPGASPPTALQRWTRCRRIEREVAERPGAIRSEIYFFFVAFAATLRFTGAFFFAAGFAFVAFFTMLPSKSRWRCRISVRGNRAHCNSITTARQKKQLPH
jgi:hypothetical protein